MVHLSIEMFTVKVLRLHGFAGKEHTATNSHKILQVFGFFVLTEIHANIVLDCYVETETTGETTLKSKDIFTLKDASVL